CRANLLTPCPGPLPVKGRGRRTPESAKERVLARGTADHDGAHHHYVRDALREKFQTLPIRAKTSLPGQPAEHLRGAATLRERRQRLVSRAQRRENIRRASLPVGPALHHGDCAVHLSRHQRLTPAGRRIVRKTANQLRL